MDETSSLAFELRARILPTIEGADQLVQQVQQLPQGISNRMQEVIQTPEFQQGLSQQQISKMQSFAGLNDMLEFQKFQEKQKEILEELDVDLQAGKLTAAQRKKYLRKFARQKGEFEKFQEKLSGELGEDYFSFLDSDKKQMMLGAINEGGKEGVEIIGGLNKQFENIVDNISKANVEARGFFDRMKELSLFAIAGLGVREAFNYARAGTEIAAKERTSFDLTNPIGMYTQRQEYELFKATRERERDYSLAGTGIGLAGGLAISLMTGGAAAPWVLGGMASGGFLGKNIAEIENIGETAETQEKLKLVNQSYSQLKNYVNSSSEFDIGRAKAIARIGQDAVRPGLEIGYMPEQKLQLRTEFADTFGKFDGDLYKEQTTFARALGIEPQDIFKLNLSARMTGMDLGIGGLKEARETAQKLYGADVSPQRIIEVLSDIKNLNEEMLKVNVDMNSRDAIAFSRIPEQIFGVDSPYGRMGDLGMDTVRQLTDLMKPKSLAHEALLFQAMDTPDLLEFTERMKGGIFSGDNFVKVMQKIQQYSGGNEGLSYFMLNEMMPNAPAGMLPRIADMLGEGGTQVTRKKIKEIDERTGEITFEQERDEKTGKMVDKTETVWMTLDKLKEEQEKYQEIVKNSNLEEGKKTEIIKEVGNSLLGFSDLARKAVSETEAMNLSIRNNMNSAADHFRSTILKIDNEWVEIWKKLGDVAESRSKLIKELEEASNKAEKALNIKLSELGINYSRDQVETARKAEKEYNLKEEVSGSNTNSLLLMFEAMLMTSKIPLVKTLGEGLFGETVKQIDKTVEDKNKVTDEKFDKKLSDVLESLDTTLKNGIKVHVSVENDSTDTKVNVNANSVFR